jgi:hypothetical protein
VEPVSFGSGVELDAAGGQAGFLDSLLGARDVGVEIGEEFL